MNCKNCGSELRSDAVFCTNCGTKIDVESAVPENNIAIEPETESQEPIKESQEPTQEPMQEQPWQQQQPWQQPQQQQPWQPLSPPPPPPVNYAPTSPAGQGKSKAGLIIGLIIGAVILIGAALFIGIELGKGMDSDGGLPISAPNPATPVPTPETDIRNTPEPPAVTTPTPPSMTDINLIGDWERISGDYLWFFGYSDLIMIVDYEDGTLGIVSIDEDHWGTGRIEERGKLVVKAEWDDIYEFQYEINGDRLTLIDIDGDTAIYERLD